MEFCSSEVFLAAIVRSNCELDGILLPSFDVYRNMILLFLTWVLSQELRKDGGGKEEVELRLSAPILFLPPFFLFINIKCHTLMLALPFLCCSVYLMSLGILAPGVITCWQFYSAWLLWMGRFPWGVFRSGWGWAFPGYRPRVLCVVERVFVALGLGRGSVMSVWGLCSFPPVPFYWDWCSFSSATAVTYTFPSSIWTGSPVTNLWSGEGNLLFIMTL